MLFTFYSSLKKREPFQWHDYNSEDVVLNWKRCWRGFSLRCWWKLAIHSLTKDLYYSMHHWRNVLENLKTSRRRRLEEERTWKLFLKGSIELWRHWWWIILTLNKEACLSSSWTSKRMPTIKRVILNPYYINHFPLSFLQHHLPMGDFEIVEELLNQLQHFQKHHHRLKEV